MFMSDMQVAKKYLLQQIVVALVVGLFITFVTQSLYITAPMLIVIIPFSIAFTIIAYDERSGWQQFRLALPISRADVITGRYASIALLVLVGVVVGLAVTGIGIAAAQLLPSVPQLAELMSNFSWQAILMASAMGLAAIFIMLSIMLPLVSRFGMTKAVRYLPLVIVFGFVIALNLESNLQMPAFVLDFVNWVKTPEGTLAAALIAVAVVVILYLASASLSVKLYAKREL
ncbi:ABC-2 transporter permease [Gordonibacter sp. An230]|uniref:ABC-2 transporter permease n=1 Tax=Gordonibacter sp. An230 TaxID=1965592 RepID=UPI001EF70889|nr:ABC-2 transporter permease [Gordonibacter sp. An230]